MKTVRNISLLIWIAIAGILTACSDTLSPQVDIIQIEGVSWASNVTTSYIAFGSTIETEELLDIKLPVSEGDLLYMIADDLQFYHRYSPENGTLLSVSFDTLNSVSAYLNGNLEYTELSGPSSLEAFSLLTDQEVNKLSTIHIQGPLSKDLLFALKQHETALPGTGLVMEGGSGSQNFNEVLSICQPDLLVIDDSWVLPDPEESPELSNLELLWIDDNVPAFSKLVKYCRNLETLIITYWEPEPGEVLPLSGLKKLQNLTIAESELTTLSGIEFPTSLHNLHMVSCDTLSDISRLGEIHQLQRLALTLCDKVEKIDLLKEMNSLYWLSFPANISHHEFTGLTERLTQLEVVELIDCWEINDLDPLLKLPKLQTLVLQLEKEQLTMIDSLVQLKLLILTNEIFDDNPEWIKELSSSLPNTTIVPGSGLCLGSGWLILLIPFILFFRYFFRQKV